MATILNEQTQYVDASGRPLVGGSVYIGDANADPVLNPKSIFSNRAMTAALANPQTLDANGRASSKIWTDGKYSLQVNDINGVQVFQDLDRGESAVTIDILNEITDVIETPANNDTLIITRDEAQAKVTVANLLAGVQSQIDTKADADETYTETETDAAIDAAIEAYAAPMWVYTTVQTTTDGSTGYDFASLPAGIDEVEVVLVGVGLDGTNLPQVQIGTGGVVKTADYNAHAAFIGTTGVIGLSYSTGFGIRASGIEATLRMRLTRVAETNEWVADYSGGGGGAFVGGGNVTLSGALDIVRLTRTGSDTFDAGKWFMRYRSAS